MRHANGHPDFLKLRLAREKQEKMPVPDNDNRGGGR